MIPQKSFASSRPLAFDEMSPLSMAVRHDQNLIYIYKISQDKTNKTPTREVIAFDSDTYAYIPMVTYLDKNHFPSMFYHTIFNRDILIRVVAFAKTNDLEIIFQPLTGGTIKLTKTTNVKLYLLGNETETVDYIKRNCLTKDEKDVLNPTLREDTISCYQWDMETKPLTVPSPFSKNPIEPTVGDSIYFDTKMINTQLANNNH